MSGDAVVTESKMFLDPDSGVEREVDICIEHTVAGHLIRICIECSSHQRARDVGWVEQMHGKHQRLPTNLLVLASESGFTRSAVEKARSFNIDTAVPGEVPDSFGSDLVGKVDELRLKTFTMTPERMRIWVEPTRDRAAEIVAALPDTLIFLADNTELTTAAELAAGLVRNVDMNNEVSRDARGNETYFTVYFDPAQLPDPSTGSMHDIYLQKEDADDKYLRRISRLEIVGPVRVQIAGIPLTHGEFRGLGYATGSSMLGEHPVLFVATETAEGQRQVTTRFQTNPFHEG
ncbi:hypothetical protein AB0H20_22040 [Nocardia fluminea]|uniref:hypothetical protein n=1 Tax=Nocardia fluminea TaxID=134984 RepID=UPI0033F32909